MRSLRSERRQRQSGYSFNSGRFIIIFLILGLLGAVGWYAYRTFYQSTTEYRVEQALANLAEADRYLLTINQVIDSEITGETLSLIDVALNSIEPATGYVNEAHGYIAAAQENQTVEEAPQLRALADSVSLRLRLLELAPELLEVTSQSAHALSAANEGWDRLSLATSASIDATAQFDLQDQAGMREAVRLNNEALEHLARARVEFGDAERSLDGLSFAPYIEYITVREQMAETAIKAANGWVANDQTALRIDLETYDSLFMQAAEMEEGLAPIPDLVATAYHDLVGVQNAEYFEIREQVTVLDNQVR